jgi:prophage regulatory protein
MADQVISAATILRRKQVELRTGLSRSTIYAWVKDGRFPAPVSLGAKAVGWLQSDIDSWISERVRSSRPTLAPIA